MDSWEALINSINLDVKSNEEKTRLEYRRLGDHLTSLKEELFAGAEYEGLYQEARELKKKIPQASKIKESIVKAAEHRKNIQERLKKSRDRLKKAESEIDEAHRKIGELAYAKYSKASVEHPEIGEVFQEIAEYRRDESEIDSELARYERSAGKKGFLKNVAEKTRVAYLRVSRSILQRKLPEVYRRAGERLCEMKLDELADEGFAPLIKDCREKKASFKAASEENRDLLDEQAKIEAEMKELGGGLTYQSSVRGLEKQIRADEQRLGEIQQSLGEQFFEKPLKEMGKKTQDHWQKIDQLRKKKNESSQNIERLKAAIDIRHLSEHNQGLNDRLKNLESSIKRQQQEADRLKEMLAQNQEKIEQLKRIRGPEKSLMKLTEDK